MIDPDLISFENILKIHSLRWQFLHTQNISSTSVNIEILAYLNLSVQKRAVY